jgi:glucuronosyltransferase
VYFGFLLSIFISYGAHGAKILGIFPFFAKSHFAVSSVLFKELANRGHQVTVLSPFPEKSPVPNYTDIDTRVTRDDLMNTTGTEGYLHRLY